MAQGITSVDAVHIPRPLRILGIAGSLRAGSFNRALLRAAREEAPSLATVLRIHANGVRDLDQVPRALLPCTYPSRPAVPPLWRSGELRQIRCQAEARELSLR